MSGDKARRRWNDRYAEREMEFGAEPNALVAEHLGGLPPGRALDLGSGQGRNAVWLAKQGHSVVAVDLSEVATRQAAEWAQRAGVDVDFITDDLLSWEPEGAAFDLVLLSYVHLREAARKLIHAKALRALAPGGTLMLIAHHRDNLEHGVGGPSSAEMLFTEEDIAADFAGLIVERNERVSRHVERGGVTAGAFDVLFIGRKPR
jgi:SAM-dependent methyltransferase